MQFAYLLLCLVGAAPAMSGPVEVSPGTYARLSVENLPVDALPHAEITVWPIEGTELLPLKTWSDEALMLFRAELPGRYLVKVTVPILDGENARLLSVEHIIEVRGPPPGPTPPTPPNPTPPPPPTPGTLTGVAYLIVVRPEQPTADQAQDLLNLRVWVDSQPAGKAEILDVTRDPRASSGAVDSRLSGYVARVPASEPLPYAFIVRQRTEGGSHVFWEGRVSGNTADLIERLKGVAP
jgi:hypothetical protein